MADRPNSQPSGWSHFLAAAIGGVAFGSWLAREQISEAKRARAEHEDPESVEAAYGKIGVLLDAWEPHPECESEDEFTQDLADWLEEHTEREIEVYPSTREGRPTILVDDILAPELKCSPSKGELDRCICQCAAYSRQWITWMVLVDASASEVGRLEDLLEDTGLSQNDVWRFS